LTTVTRNHDPNRAKCVFYKVLSIVTEPGKTELSKTELCKIELCKTELCMTELCKSEIYKSELTTQCVIGRYTASHGRSEVRKLVAKEENKSSQ
jgi:hypothetical protein